MMRAKSWFVAAVLGLTMAAPATGWADHYRGFDGRAFEHRHGRFQGPAEVRPFCHVPPPYVYAPSPYRPYRDWRFHHQRFSRDFDRDDRFDNRQERFERWRERRAERQEARREHYCQGPYAYRPGQNPPDHIFNNSHYPADTGDPRFDAAVGMIPLAQQMFNRNP